MVFLPRTFLFYNFNIFKTDVKISSNLPIKKKKKEGHAQFTVIPFNYRIINVVEIVVFLASYTV